MCKLLEDGLKLLDKKDRLNYVLNEINFNDSKEDIYVWDFVGHLFDPIWCDGGFFYYDFYIEKAINEEYDFCQILQAFEDRGYTAEFYKQLNLGEVYLFLCECELEDRINFYFYEDFYSTDKENFIASLYAIGRDYGLENLKNVCIQRAEKAGFKDFFREIAR